MAIRSNSTSYAFLISAMRVKLINPAAAPSGQGFQEETVLNQHIDRSFLRRAYSVIINYKKLCSLQRWPMKCAAGLNRLTLIVPPECVI